MSAALAVWAINFYRKHLSKRKGYHCAYGVATGRATCSGVGLRAFKKAGWSKGFALLRRQFDRCAICAAQLGEQRALAQGQVGKATPVGSAPHAHAIAGVSRIQGGPLGSQAGFVDCGGCDAPSCDVPSCDLPDLPSCDVPSCEMPHMPSCELPSIPSCEMPHLPNWTGCSSASEAATEGCASPCSSGGWEALYCMDCSPCPSWGSGSTTQEKADKAKERQEEEQRERDQRRADAAAKERDEREAREREGE